MPNIYENGIIRPATPAEIAEMERLAAELPVPEPTAEERVAEMTKQLAERDALILELLSNKEVFR